MGGKWAGLTPFFGRSAPKAALVLALAEHDAPGSETGFLFLCGCKVGFQWDLRKSSERLALGYKQQGGIGAKQRADMFAL